MEIIKKVNFLLIGLSVLLVFGCDSDEPEPKSKVVAVPVSCMLSKITWANSAPSEAEVMINDMSGKFLCSDFANIRTMVKYDDRRKHIIERSICDKDQVVIHRAFFKYDNRGLLTRMTTFGPKPSSPGLDTLGYSIYKYDAGNRLSTVNTRLNYSNQSPNILNGVDSVFYLPNNGIRYKKYLFTSGTTGATLNKTIDYSFDDHKNAYSLSRWFYYNDITEGDMLPTEHNIASIKTIDHTKGTIVTTSFTYEYDSNDYPVKWTQFNSLYSGVYASGGYEYNCK